MLDSPRRLIEGKTNSPLEKLLAVLIANFIVTERILDSDYTISLSYIDRSDI